MLLIETEEEATFHRSKKIDGATLQTNTNRLFGNHQLHKISTIQDTT